MDVCPSRDFLVPVTARFVDSDGAVVFKGERRSARSLGEAHLIADEITA